MPKYRVVANQIYYNQVTDTFEAGLLLGDSQLQHGDTFEAKASQVKDVKAAGGVVDA
jgi:hypothetical protein